MSQPILLPEAFDGMAQDYPRNNLPKGKAWNFIDHIPQALGAPATERGGWGYAGAAMGVFGVASLVHAPFNAGAKLLSIDQGGVLWNVLTATSIGSVASPVQNPFMHQQLVVIPSQDGTTAPKKYDGTTLAALGATAPAGKYGCVFVNYTWLGGSAAAPQTGYASAVNDPTSYVTSGVDESSLDASFPIRGMAALPNVMLWFGDEKTARIRGTTPPPETDMQMDDPVFNYGVSDARSIAVNGSVACFANDIGVFLTNGTAFPEDLTRSCGLSKYWRDLCMGRTSSWTLAGGWYGSIYVICVMNASTLIDTIAFDTMKRNAYRFSNIKTWAFAAAGVTGQELYAGSSVTPRVMKLSSMWTPGSSFKNDADGTPVLGTWESPFYDTQKVFTQRWRWAYLMHDLRDAAADAPTWTVSYCTSPEAGATYTALSPTLGATTSKQTSRLQIAASSKGIGFKVTRQNAAALARLYGIGATTYEREK